MDMQAYIFDILYFYIILTMLIGDA